MNRSNSWLLLIAVGVFTAFVRADDEKEAAVEPPDRSVLLARDPLVQAELALKPEQVKAVNELMDATDAQLWPVNPLPAAEGAEKAREILTGAEAKLKAILSTTQQARFRQIGLQYQGPPAVLNPDLAVEFKLTDEQRKSIRSSVDKTQQALVKIDELARAGRPRDFLDKARRAVRAELRDDVLELLDADQKAKWSRLVGKPFNVTRIKTPCLRAPEFRDTGQWLNSKPLTLGGLRGHVVMVHFYTFGCENCIRNYPAYKAWTATLVPKGLTIIGIHTPETKAEQDVEQVRIKARESGLKFPILVDNERKNWTAWGNGIWPSVYLIDKQGYVRYWWLGELGWKGAPGQSVMARHIEALLEEGPATTAPASAPSSSSPTKK